MIVKTKYMLASTALVALFLLSGPVRAEVVVHETVTETKDGKTVQRTTTKESAAMPGHKSEMYWSSDEHSMTPSGARVVNFMDFDLNEDKILSINEVGKMLFKLYDTDGNELIDNNEYERRAVVTIMPIEKNTIVSYDFDGDGFADKTKYTYETFIKDTLLTKFDKNRDGLSPHEFMDMTIIEADVNNDKMIDLGEWQGSYIPSVDKINKRKALYNK